MAKKKKYPGPWRRVERGLTGAYTLRLRYAQRELSLRPIIQEVWRRRLSRSAGDYEERKERFDGPDLDHILEKLKLTDHHDSLILMMSQGLAVFDKLVERWDWYVRRETEKECRRRRLAYLGRKKEHQEKKLDLANQQRVKGREGPARRIEI